VASLVNQATRLMRSLADIVTFAHRLDPPIVHRDLKPANILLQPTSEGRVSLRVADFGIGGIAVRQAAEQTRRGTTRGRFLASALRGAFTPVYASPQQMHGEDPDPRDDVHALGVIWFQLLTGDLRQAPGIGYADDLQALGVPAGTVRLLGRCVAPRPEKRLGDAAVLAKELQILLKEAAQPEALLQPPGEIAGQPRGGPGTRFTCPACHNAVIAPCHLAGKECLCPHCRQRLRVPHQTPQPTSQRAPGAALLDWLEEVGDEPVPPPPPTAFPRQDELPKPQPNPPAPGPLLTLPNAPLPIPRFTETGALVHCPACKKVYGIGMEHFGTAVCCPCGGIFQVVAAPGMVPFDCPNCGCEQEIPERMAGRQTSCLSCGNSFQVPTSAILVRTVPEPPPNPLGVTASPSPGPTAAPTTIMAPGMPPGTKAAPASPSLANSSPLLHEIDQMARALRYRCAVGWPTGTAALDSLLAQLAQFGLHSQFQLPLDDWSRALFRNLLHLDDLVPEKVQEAGAPLFDFAAVPFAEDLRRVRDKVFEFVRSHGGYSLHPVKVGEPEARYPGELNVVGLASSPYPYGHVAEVLQRGYFLRAIDYPERKLVKKPWVKLAR
jgi:hypothetical protein